LRVNRQLPSRDDSGFPGSDILSRRSPREVLERLVEGDPLEIEARCVERIHADAVLVCVRRLQLRSMARIAYTALRYRGEPALDAWLAERIAFSMRELLDEDREEERLKVPPSRPWDPRYAFLSEALGVEPTLARRACVDFNLLPRGVRSTYFAVLVEGKTIHRYVAEGHGPPERVQSQLRLALRTLGRAIGQRTEESTEGTDDDA
jgi:hypothetical protein